MCAGVFGRQIVGIVCRDQGNPGALRQFHQRLPDAVLRLEAMLLNFKEVVALAHDFLKLDRRLCRSVRAIARQHRRRHARHARRQSNQTLAVLGQQFLIDAGFVIETFRKGL